MAELGDTIRIGLLGASRIARGSVIKPTADIGGVEVTRIAARSIERAQEYAAEHGIPGVEANYAALVASDAVDLVYNALPPSGHMEWSIAALQAGKHVLCEKPLAMNADEARRMVAAAEATGLTLIEAFHYRFHPLFVRILDIVGAGTIGDVQSLRSHFNVPIPYRAGELRHTPEVGGGALMDLGCYPVHWVRTVMGQEPAVISAAAVQEREGVDVTMQATLDFGGIPAEVSCSMATSLAPGLDAALTITGSKGRLHAINPLSPHSHHELILEAGDARTTETVPGNTTYWHQLQHVVDVLAGNAEQLTGGDDAVANMRAIDAIYEAAGMQPRGSTG